MTVLGGFMPNLLRCSYMVAVVTVVVVMVSQVDARILLGSYHAITGNF